MSFEKDYMRLPDMGRRYGKQRPIGAVWGYDMNGYRAELLTIAQSGHGELPPGALVGVEWGSTSREDAPDSSLRCVSSGYLADGCSCRSSIPADVVAAAWEEELERGGVQGDRFFRFAWHGGVWLAYGLKNGRVRGVYCPSHNAERDERSFLGESPESFSTQQLALSA
jgi:hypothetical protein